MTLIPKEIYKAGAEINNSFIDRIDHRLREEGEYHNLIYLSSINFLLRKIIKSAHYYKKKSEIVDDYDYIEQSRKYLGEILNFEENEVEKILSLVIIIVSYYEKKPSSGARNELIKKSKTNGTPCYMCGKAINYDDSTSFEFIEVEHVWPKGMGGV